ncbi:MAG: hypothetical protein LR011_02465 [Verrucomicrobia bacterium]|nr:hypothetical protein [Verrucomicrobiota bacterium]
MDEVLQDAGSGADGEAEVSIVLGGEESGVREVVVHEFAHGEWDDGVWPAMPEIDGE